MLEISRQHVCTLMAENPLDMVEYAARVCYDSHNKTDPDKTADFVRGLIKRGHCTPLEHAYVRIHIDKLEDASTRTFAHALYQFAAPGDYPFADRRLSRGVFYRGEDEDGLFVSGNLRDLIWYLNKHSDAVELMQSEAVTMDPYYMVCDIKTDRGIATEFFRHRTMAYDDDGYQMGYKSIGVDLVQEPAVNQQSTRYVNYEKKPVYIINQEPATWAHDEDSFEYKLWLNNCTQSIRAYSDLINSGVTPEFARSVLPMCLGTRVILSGTITNWVYLLNLRLPKGAHPMARLLAAMIWERLKSTKVWYDNAMEFMASSKLDGEFNAVDFDKEAAEILTLLKHSRGKHQCQKQPMDSSEPKPEPDTATLSTPPDVKKETTTTP